MILYFSFHLWEISLTSHNMLSYNVYRGFRQNLGKSSKVIIFVSLLTPLKVNNNFWGGLVITWYWLKLKNQTILAKLSFSTSLIHKVRETFTFYTLSTPSPPHPHPPKKNENRLLHWGQKNHSYSKNSNLELWLISSNISQLLTHFPILFIFWHTFLNFWSTFLTLGAFSQHWAHFH